MINFENQSPEELPTPKFESKSIEAEPLPDLVAKYSLFRENLTPKDDVIYHPCGANDISPSIAFPGSRIIYVDIDKKSIDALKRSGYEAHEASALEFNPGDVDILIMLNPGISPDIPSSHVVENGFVLSNDYHGTASSLHNNEQYQLRAIIRVSKNGELILDTENLDDYWKEIETEEEFKNAPFDWGAANYQMAVHVVKAITSEEKNILTEYKKIITKAREEQRQKNVRLLQEHPELAELISSLDQEDALILNHKGRQFTLATTLPRKKGTVDDIFVFQKNGEKILHEE